MLIAVASKAGIEIDQHFGHAQQLYIFAVDGGQVAQVGVRPVAKYCTFDADHPLRGHILRDTAALLQDCAALVCAQIGQAPQEELGRLGIPVYVASGGIAPTLQELAKVL